MLENKRKADEEPVGSFYWYIDINNIHGPYKNRELAICAGSGDAKESFFTGDVEFADVDYFAPDADLVIDYVVNLAYDNFGECPEGYLVDDVDEVMELSLSDALSELWCNWVGKFALQPKFYRVHNVRLHTCNKI